MVNNGVRSSNVHSQLQLFILLIVSFVNKMINRSAEYLNSEKYRSAQP